MENGYRLKQASLTGSTWAAVRAADRRDLTVDGDTTPFAAPGTQAQLLMERRHEDPPAATGDAHIAQGFACPTVLA